MARYLTAVILLVLAAACAPLNHEQQSALTTGSPVVYIHPTAADLRQAAIAVLPFQLPAGVDEERGKQVAALFQDVLLGKGAFRTVKLVDVPYGNIEEALEIGGRAGADLVLAGRIHHLMSGAGLGGSRLEVSVRVVAVDSGHTVWYIRQAMDEKMNYPDLSLGRRLTSIFNVPQVSPSAGAPRIPNMLVHMAVAMSEVMAGARSVQKM